MFGRIAYTWQIMGASLNVLKRDKALILFPLFSGIACLLVIASFGAPLFAMDTHWLKTSMNNPTPEQKIIGWVYLFAFYFVSYFVITFFNVGIVACAVTTMSGGAASFSGGLQAAFKRIHLIAGWALLSATVGLILRIIESYSKKAGRFVTSILGAAWTIMTFLAVPVLVVENKGPIAAVKESATLLKKTWGTQVIGNSAFGLIFLLLFLPGIFAGIGAFYLLTTGAAHLAIMVGGLAATYLIILALIQSALHSIFQAAVYMHTQGVQDETRAFPVTLLRDAMCQNA